MEMDLFNELLKIQQERFELIKQQWGFSTVQLKKWLNMYDKEYIRGKDEKLMEINVNRLLPYTKTKKSMLYGDYAIERLELAIKAKAVIMMINSDLEDIKMKERFIIECFYLFLRIDSTRTLKLTYEKFGDIVMNTYQYVILSYKDNEKWDSLIKELEDKCMYYKPKRIPVLYHYKLEDFEMVKYCDTWKEAYIKWTNEVFPTLLDKYKENEINKFKQYLQVRSLDGHKLKTEHYEELINKRKAELDRLKINCPKTVKHFKAIVEDLKKNNKGQ